MNTIPLSTEDFLGFLLSQAWHQFRGTHSTRGQSSPAELSFVQWNRSIAVVITGITVEGYDLAFGFDVYRSDEIHWPEPTWRERDLLAEIESSTGRQVLAPPRIVELYATPEGAERFSWRVPDISLISGLRIQSANSSNVNGIILAADQEVPCMLKFSSNDDVSLLAGMSLIAKSLPNAANGEGMTLVEV